MQRNTELFDKIADLIEQHPEQYSQRFYASSTPCGTTCCIAGHAAVLSGKAETKVKKGPHGYSYVIFRDRWRHRVNPHRAGMKALGLTEAEAYSLFAGSWKPRNGVTVPEALRKIGGGADIEEVSR